MKLKAMTSQLDKDVLQVQFEEELKKTLDAKAALQT